MYATHDPRIVAATAVVLWLVLAGPVPAGESLTAFIQDQFPEWDSDHNGRLDLHEVAKQIETRSVRGREAAALVAIYRRLDEEGERGRLTRREALALADERGFQKAVDRLADRLASLERKPFLAGDPNLDSFRQGGVGDCYLLAAIASAVHRDPEAVRDMIQPGKKGAFEVRFGDGQKVHVPAVTDAELLLGAKMDGSHGIWLAILEKAYGIVRERERAKKGKDTRKDDLTADIIDGGSANRIMEMLTGHEVMRVRSQQRAKKGDLVVSGAELEGLLKRITRERRLAGCGFYPRKGEELPRGLISGHCYALLGYDSKTREVEVFNPWGNTFKPKGPPGVVNGYPTDHGRFKVPFDEFRIVYSGVSYETSKPDDRARR